MKIALLLLALVVSVVSHAATFTQGPGVLANPTGCEYLITVTRTSSGGVWKSTVLTLPGSGIFGFDGDRACSPGQWYSPVSTPAQGGDGTRNPTGYGSFNVSGTGISPDF